MNGVLFLVYPGKYPLTVELTVKCDITRGKIYAADEVAGLLGTMTAIHAGIFPLN